MLTFISLDPLVGFTSVLTLLFIIFGLTLKKMKQPYIVGYILIGAILGQHGFGLVEDAETIRHLGEIGIILLLFFIGMEISIPELVKQWKVAAIGTVLQVAISVLIILAIGYYFEWSISRSVLLGFVISLSSSAVIIKIMQDKEMIDSRIGKNVLSVLLMQDIIIVPLLIISSFLGGKSVPVEDIVLMLVGGVIIILLLIYLYQKRSIALPFTERIKGDLELQVFLAVFMCFGGAFLSSLFGLSAALGAFIGGMVIHASKGMDWIFNTLHSFRVLFVSLFFVSIGLQINIDFIVNNASAVILVLIVVLTINHMINSVILKVFACTWKEALLGGALLAQIGELSFLLSASAFDYGIISNYGYDFTITLISLTLIISPIWILMTEKLLYYSDQR